MSNSVRPHRRQLIRLPRPWDSPGKNTGVGCHFLLQCRKGKSESEVAQSCPTLSDPIDCSLPGSSVHWVFQEYWSGVREPCQGSHQKGSAREVPCSALKGETVPDSLPATPKSPPTRRVPPRGRTERLHFHFSLSCIGEGNGNPLQCSCLENPRDGGAWWAAVSGRTESDTTEATA